MRDPPGAQGLQGPGPLLDVCVWMNLDHDVGFQSQDLRAATLLTWNGLQAPGEGLRELAAERR